jgi:hypothetical protein
MPTVFRHNGIRFFFYSNEGDPREPIHIHALLGVAEAKFWLYPEVSVARSQGFNARDLAKMVDIVEEHRSLIERKWDEHFNS